ncbi:MAG: phosphotriesterase family protein [Actinomycetota bacterium]
MATVQTVLGPIDTAQLGPTLMHEHILFSYPGDELDPTDTWDRAECIAVAVERMQQLLEHGIRTFVDPCAIEVGRDPELMADVAERSGMQVVCATGFYKEEVGLPYYWRVRTAEEIAELYLREIEKGIRGTGIKPGIIKVASGDPPTEAERKAIAGAAIAARESGLTVVTHCEKSVGADVQQQILTENGADLVRCMIGHQDEAEKPQQLIDIVERGSYVAVDRIGLEILSPDDHRVELIKAVLDAGHQDRLCLSQDHMCSLRSPRFPFHIPAHLASVADQLLPFVLDQIYRRPHTFIFTDFLPKLEAAGVDRATFYAILADNPRRLFGG